MKKHKVKCNRKIKTCPFCIIPTNYRPSSLSEYLHKYKLCSHKWLKITKLGIHSIFHTGIIRYSIFKQFHSDHTKNIIGNEEKWEEFYEDGDDYCHLRPHSTSLVVYGVRIETLYAWTLATHQLYQCCDTEDACHF